MAVEELLLDVYARRDRGPATPLCLRDEQALCKLRREEQTAPYLMRARIGSSYVDSTNASTATGLGSDCKL